MPMQWVMRILLGALVLGLLGFGGWILSLPAEAVRAPPPPVPAAETKATLAALKPARRGRPLVAIIGINDATEATDYLMPYGILKRADVADVMALATAPGPVKLYPALTVLPDATLAAFDAAHPQGADYVIVPAMRHADDPAVLDWIRRQAGKGVRVIGVCAGATIVANAGLLDGKRATTHWFYRDAMLKAHPAIRYIADRRLVSDGGVMTTTGISASMPAMLTLVEAIAGPAKAQAVAAELGLAHWDTRHRSGAFRLDRPFALTVTGNVLALWNRERIGIALAPGVDEVSLALAADAWSRTYRSRAITLAPTQAPVTSRSGLRILPDKIDAQWPGRREPGDIAEPPARALDATLEAIARRYGAATARVVAMQLEYPWPAAR